MTNLFGRNIELIIDRQKYTNKDFEINFDISFDDDSEPNVSKVEIYNLSSATLNGINTKSKVILNAGYAGDIGSLLIGEVKELETIHDSLDKVLKLMVVDGSQDWFKTVINKTYRSNIKASQVLAELLGSFGLQIGEIQLTEDITYTNGLNLSGQLQNNIKKIANDTGSRFYVKNGVIFIRPEKKGTETGFLLNSDTGLIGSPEKLSKENAEGHKVQMLLNHRINVDSLIRIESRGLTGNFKVKKGSHKGSFITECEVMPL